MYSVSAGASVRTPPHASDTVSENFVGLHVPARKAPDHNTSDSSLANAVSRAVDVGIELDMLGIAQAIQQSVSIHENQDAFVKSVGYSAYYEAGGCYNIMVVNLSNEFDQRFIGVKAFVRADYHGKFFGVWAFEDGSFENKGHGTYHNWFFMGSWSRHGRDGKFVQFYKRC